MLEKEDYDTNGNVKKAIAESFCYTYQYRPDGKLLGSLAGNGYVTYNIDMGKVIGTNGESSIRIVTNGYTNKIISAYPIP